MEMALTLPAIASMPLRFWDETIRTSVYLINRLPSKVISNKTPLEVLFHTKPNYDSLKVFRCSCFLNLRPYNSHKLEFRFEKCTFLGFNLNHKRLYVSKFIRDNLYFQGYCSVQWKLVSFLQVSYLLFFFFFFFLFSCCSFTISIFPDSHFFFYVAFSFCCQF